MGMRCREGAALTRHILVLLRQAVQLVAQLGAFHLQAAVLLAQLRTLLLRIR